MPQSRMTDDRPRPAPSPGADPLWLTVAETAARLRTSPDTVLRLIKAGELRASNAGTSDARPRWIVAEEDLQDFLRRRANRPAEERRERKGHRGKLPNYL